MVYDQNIRSSLDGFLDDTEAGRNGETNAFYLLLSFDLNPIGAIIGKFCRRKKILEV
jgi:hypothetical protein